MQKLVEITISLTMRFLESRLLNILLCIGMFDCTTAFSDLKLVATYCKE